MQAGACLIGDDASPDPRSTPDHCSNRRSEARPRHVRRHLMQHRRVVTGRDGSVPTAKTFSPVRLAAGASR